MESQERTSYLMTLDPDMKIAIAQLNPIIGDLEGNSKKIIKEIREAQHLGADLILFSELALTGYPPEDLLLLPHFIDAVGKKLDEIILATEGITAIVGLPRRSNLKTGKPLFNSAAIIENQSLIGFHDKILLPTYDVFDERRYFEPGQDIKTWVIKGERVAITICEEIWEHGKVDDRVSYIRDPIADLKEHQAELLLNLSASPYSFNKFSRRLEVCRRAALSLNCPVILCNQVGANDSLLFDGQSIYAHPNNTFQSAKGFVEELQIVETKSLTPSFEDKDLMKDLYRALVMGIRDYFYKLGFKKACLGVSGGIDSAVVLALAIEALGAKNILAISMPSRYTSKGSRRDAETFAKQLNVEFNEISIEGPFQSYLQLLEPHFKEKPHDTTEENMQARIRGMILMAFSNKFGGLVLNASNKSELAVGYSTLYGDMCGALAVIGDLSKTKVYALARWMNRHKEIIPQSIIDRAPSAELRENQKDSDTLPPYDVVDQIVEAYVEEHRSVKEIVQQYGLEKKWVEELINKIDQNEYKRRQGAPILRVTERCFSVGRRFPIVQRST
jgi:NAD+ synthase (glutamine-hydrolysing)